MNLSLFGNPIIHEIEKNGYFEFLNKEMDKQSYDKIYVQFDQLMRFIHENPKWIKKLYLADEEFHSYIENYRCGSPPMGYIDDGKSNKCKKVYFHYTKEYEQFLKEKYPTLFEESRVFTKFIALLEKIYENSLKNYGYFIRELESSQIPLSDIMYTEEGKLVLLIKVVRYEKSEVAGSNPHYDFSALSLLLDNTDEGEETLQLAPYKEFVALSDFSRPNRKYKRSDVGTSVLLIPGLALKELGYSLNPTPHIVLCQSSPRYAVISFAMVPAVHLRYDQIKLRQLKIIP